MPQRDQQFRVVTTRADVAQLNNQIVKWARAVGSRDDDYVSGVPKSVVRHGAPTPSDIVEHVVLDSELKTP